MKISAIRRIALRRILLFSFAIAVWSPLSAAAQTKFVDSAASALSAALSPVDYVVHKSSQYRIVLIGEAHRIAHDVALVENIIPRLPNAHVNTLAVEWLRASDQTAANALVQAPACEAG